MRLIQLRWRTAFLTLGVGMIAAGCHRDDVTVYQVPKGSENSTPLAVSPSEAPDAADPAGQNAAPRAPMPQGQLKFSLPEGWKEIPPAGMSVASFSMAGDKAQLSVMSFPSAAISELEMVNIVRQKSGLPALKEDELSKLLESVTVGGEKGSLIDFTAAAQPGGDAKNSTTKLALTVVSHGPATWFFKIAGDAETVTAQKPALIEFLKSVQFPEASGEALPSGHPSVAANSVASSASGAMPQMGSDVPANPADVANKPHWEVPKNWVEKPPTQMLLAKFSATNSGASADVTVSFFPGTVGGILANVNRWRASLGLAAISEDDLATATSSLDVPGGKAILADMTGKNAKTGNDARLIGVIWPREGETWFYKMLGDPAAVSGEKDSFVKFVQSVRY